MTIQLIRGQPNVDLEDWPLVGEQCGSVMARIRWGMASKIVDISSTVIALIKCTWYLLIPKQQKEADLGVAGGQEDIEYCRGLKDQGGTTGNKDNWQLFVERPGIWVSICICFWICITMCVCICNCICVCIWLATRRTGNCLLRDQECRSAFVLVFVFAFTFVFAFVFVFVFHWNTPLHPRRGQLAGPGCY